ncbi:hypothetical protein ACLFLE_20640, partial [Providencia vermicola]
SACIDHVAFIIKTEIDDISSSKYEKEQLDYKKHNWLINDKPEKLAAMQSLISHLHGRPMKFQPKKGSAFLMGLFAMMANRIKKKFRWFLKTLNSIGRSIWIIR